MKFVSKVYINNISDKFENQYRSIIFMGVMPLGNVNIMENHFVSALTPCFHRILVKFVSKVYINNISDEFENQY